MSSPRSGTDGTTVEASPVDDEIVDRAVRVLRAGGLVAIPTETVYGLGADAANDSAVRRVFAVKGRPADHPLIVHLASEAQLGDWAAEVPEAAHVLASAFWPGPLTLLLRRAPSVSDVVTGGRPTIALRVPDHPVALAVLRAFGGGIAAPSANRFGRVSPTTPAHVRSDLGDDVNLVLDGGSCGIGVESTIVDLTGAEPVVLRTGAITSELLSQTLGVPVAVHGGESAPASSDSEGGARAPGMLASHYAPDARVHVVTSAEAVAVLSDLLAADEGLVGLLAPTVLAGVPDGVVELEPVGPPDEYAALLYARLRQADRLGLRDLVCVAPPSEGIGSAVIDRLRRASVR